MERQPLFRVLRCLRSKMAGSPLRPLPPSAQVPSPILFVQPPQPGATLGKNCIQLEARQCTGEESGTSTYDELHDLRRRRGHARMNSEAASTSRLSVMNASGRTKARCTRDESHDVAGKRNCVEEPHLALVADKEAAKGRAQSWNPR